METKEGFDCKYSEFCGADRISSLPDPLIHKILSFLPSTKDAAKTGILSKRWHCQWTNVPNLVFEFLKDFDLETSEEDDESLKSFTRFVKSSLMVNSCVYVDKLMFKVNTGYKSLNHSLALMIDFAQKKKVQQFILDFDYANYIEFDLPECIFDNNFVTDMRIVFCRVMVGGNVSWSSLRIFCIENVSLANEDLEKIISGSPALESMTMDGCTGFNQLHFDSKSFKRLILRGICPLYYGFFSVSSPHVEEFELSSFWGMNGVDLDLPSVVRASFDFDKFYKSIYDVVNPSGEFLKEILHSVQHVRELELGAWCIQVLSVMEVKHLPCPLLNVRNITVDTLNSVNLPGIANLLRNSPELEKLTIKLNERKQSKFYFHGGSENFIGMAEQYWESYKMSSNPLSHLMAVEIIGLNPNDGGHELVLEFIKYVLMNAGVLQQMIIDMHDCNGHFVSEVAEILLRMTKSSPNVNIKFLS